MANAPRIVVIGSLNMDLVARVDRLPCPGETVRGHRLDHLPGGKGANQAVAASRLGAQTEMIGCVGDDAYGGELRQALAAAGVGLQTLRSVPDCSTGTAMIGVDRHGENCITVIPGANDRLTVADVERCESMIRAADAVLVQLEIPIETVLCALSLARRCDVLTILDPAPAPTESWSDLSQVDWITPNEHEARQLSGCDDESDGLDDVVSRLRQCGASNVVVTLGDEGAIVVTPQGDRHPIPAFEVNSVDSTACGDAFAAALAVGLVEGVDRLQAVRFACAAGALAATIPGAQPAMPDRALVEGVVDRSRS